MGRLLKIGAALLVLNEIRGLAVVATALWAWWRWAAPSPRILTSDRFGPPPPPREPQQP